MDQAEELLALRTLVREAVHDLSNSIGIALNYTSFLGEDIGGADRDHPVWASLAPVEAALRRSADRVRKLRDDVLPPTA